MTRLVALTGATGFVGQHLVAALGRRGWRVRLLVRRWKPVPALEGVDAEIVLGDLSDERALGQLVRGADAVVHAAGAIKARRDEEFRRVNADSTVRLAAAAGGTPFLLLSSLAAREPALSPYAASKRAGEEALAGYSGRWVAVRAPAVYGPGDRETLTYFKAASRGLALEPRQPGSRLSLIHVADLCQALAGTLERWPEPGVYEIDDGTVGGYGYADMAAAAGQALGRRPLRLAVPRWSLQAVASANAALQQLGGPAAILSAGKVRELFHSDWTIHDRRLASAIGHEPQFDLTNGFRDTVQWYRSQGWLG
jgi:nucleoside-diphosphate-sugar epimerase